MTDPLASKATIVDIIHGVAVPDPFRRLESADDPETIAWVAGQNARTRAALDGPDRERLVARLRELNRVPRMSVAALRGERIFFTENDGTRPQSVLYRADASGLGADALVDPNLLDAAGTTAITCFEPDDTGARVVYGLSRNGSDEQELLIHDVASGAALADRLEWVKFASIAWAGDAFFYTRYPAGERYGCQVWLHRVGDPQAGDRLIYQRPDAPEITFDVKITCDGRQLVIAGYQGASDHAEIHVVPLPETFPLKPHHVDVVPLVSGFTAGWHFIDGRDDRLYFRTDADAPFGRIVRIDLEECRDRTPEGVRHGSEAAETIVPESRDTIVDAAIADGRLLVSSLHNAS